MTSVVALAKLARLPFEIERRDAIPPMKTHRFVKHLCELLAYYEANAERRKTEGKPYEIEEDEARALRYALRLVLLSRDARLAAVEEAA